MRLVYLAIGWAAGIILASNFENLTLTFWLRAAATIGIVVWAVWNFLPRWRMAAVVLLVLSFGGIRYALVPQTSAIAAYNNQGGLTIEGLVIDEPDIREDRVQFRVEVESLFHARYDGPIDGIVLVQAPRLADVAYGDRVRATGLLITPAEYDTFSYADYLAREGVFSIMRNAAVAVVSSGHGQPFYTLLYNIKDQAQQAINNTLPDPQAALLSGILLGNESGISPGLSDDFSAVGASHIIAISGFNMTIISAFIMGMLDRFRVNRVVAAVTGIAFIIAYTLLVGANAAVVRAAFMSVLLVAAALFKRKTYVPASLAFVAMVMSIQNPMILWDLSFQLSFLATLGLALFVDPLSTRFDALLHRVLPAQPARFVGDVLNEPLIVSVAAQIATLPLIVLYFDRLSLVSLPVNLLVVPVQTWLLVVGALATILALILPGLALIFFWLDMILLSWSIAVVRLFAQLPFADVDFYVDDRLIALFYLMLIGGAVMYAARPSWSVRLGQLIRRRPALNAIGAAGVGLFVLMLGMFLSRPDGYLHVWFLDMGHSNAVLLQSPGGAHMLVDGGRFPARLLTALGDRMPFYDREIEVLALTQPDEFDYGALPAVLERYDVGVALSHGQPNESETFAQLESALAGAERVTVRAGYTLDFDDGVYVEVLHPQDQPTLGDSLNDEVMVLRVTYGEISFLLTSDLSRAGQAALLDRGEWPLASVMQLPQHGTVQSLGGDFLTAVQPQVILLQSDPANRRGDPNADTLSLLGDVPLFRTDEGGTIHLWTDGVGLWVVQESAG